MTTDGSKIKKRAEKLRKDISVLKKNIHDLQNILIKIDSSQQEEKDKEEMKKIEAQLQ